jgi:hypothetical protein
LEAVEADEDEAWSFSWLLPTTKADLVGLEFFESAMTFRKSVVEGLEFVESVMTSRKSVLLVPLSCCSRRSQILDGTFSKSLPSQHSAAYAFFLDYHLELKYEGFQSKM